MADGGINGEKYGTTHFPAPYTPQRPIPNVQRFEQQRKNTEKESNANDSQSSESVTQPQRDIPNVGDAIENCCSREGHDAIKDNGDGSGPTNPMDKSNGKDPVLPGQGSKYKKNPVESEVAYHQEADADHYRRDTGRDNCNLFAKDENAPRNFYEVQDEATKKESAAIVPQVQAQTPGIMYTKLESKLNDAVSYVSTLIAGVSQYGNFEGKSKTGLEPNEVSQTVMLELARMYQHSMTTGFMMLLLPMVFLLVLGNGICMISSADLESSPQVLLRLTIYTIGFSFVGMLAGSGMVWRIHIWTKRRGEEILWNESMAAEKQRNKEGTESLESESAQWLNSLAAVVWPLVNPDLFTGLSNALEDVMQASLPKMIRMVKVEDIGQGSENVRILNVRRISDDVTAPFLPADSDSMKSTRSFENNGQKPSGKEEEHSDATNDLKAEEGEFINIELTLAYKARSVGKTLKNKAENAHLLLAFYLPGGISFPVWVSLLAFKGTLHLHLQVISDPPFFSLCTLTFMSQPKVDLSCVPLARRFLNMMDLPIISHFLQNSVDTAMSQCVAPKSITLHLKDMLVGDDFKKDTEALGVLVITINRAWGLKQPSGNLAAMINASSDLYVTVGWVKYGRPKWSTRTIFGESEPVWKETAFLLVNPEDLNVLEGLRVEVWNSQRAIDDDDRGRVELDLNDIIRSEKSRGTMWHRQDKLQVAGKPEKDVGHIEWSVGYFAKTKTPPDLPKNSTEETDIKDVQQLKSEASTSVKRKLRAVTEKDKKTKEIKHRTRQEFHSKLIEMITSVPPPQDYPSGIFSIQIHQVTDLELKNPVKNKHRGDSRFEDEEEEEGGDLPSSYCTVIINHQKVFKTRTKPKSDKPFFNAGLEYFIRDWRTTNVILSVREARVHEEDPILGVVNFSLNQVFKTRSQSNDIYPLIGGLSYGRVRISMVFRPVMLQSASPLLGWDYGTLEIEGIRSKDLDKELGDLKIKASTMISKGKLIPSSGSSNSVPSQNFSTWCPKNGHTSLKLAVRKRYSSALILGLYSRGSSLSTQNLSTSLGFTQKPIAFGVFWLKNIADDRDFSEIEIPVYKLQEANFENAKKNCLDEISGHTDKLGQPVGHLHANIKFTSGLNIHHLKLINQDENLADIAEILDCVAENRAAEADRGVLHEDDSSSGDEDSDSMEDERPKNMRQHNSGKEDEYSLSGKEDEYSLSGKSRSKRRHKGVMQWQAPRTLHWMKTKIGHGEDKIKGVFKHEERDTVVESET